jgi:hypothetical protein
LRGERTLHEQIVELDVEILGIVNARNANRREGERMDMREIGDRIDPLQRVAYIARQFFDCQFLFVTLR